MTDGDNTGLDIRDLSMSDLLAGFAGRKKKVKPQSVVVKREGEEGTFVIDGVSGISRNRNRNSGGPRRGETGLQMGNNRPVRPDRITQGEE